MSHEIYYTSAPEGLKRGSSGFSTVGATDGIPKALWDRLEALSAYRHHFGVATAEGGGSSGQNPVSYAHWLLSVTGTTYHVLSRVCDSGVDHTQRSNAFAHHLVLEAPERAGGGPAWMLSRSGVMESVWNGKVEAISRRSPLPLGDSSSGVCRQWAAVTGDAGWGGVLADLFVKSPGKPVCVLFSPGQNILPLIAETIALLPPAARWNVTFNTYFTSMPTSATCLWRCCLAGTPAAQVGLRYAAAGTVIDLTDRTRLGTISEGPYVTMARTGIVPATAAAGPATTGPRTAANKPAAKLPPNTPKSATPQLPMEDEDQERGPYDFAEDIAEVNDEIDATLPGATNDRQIPKPPSVDGPIPEITVFRPKKQANPGIRAVDAAMRYAEGEAANAASQRRRQIMWMFFGALGAIAVGTGLVLLAARNSAPPELPPIHRDQITVLTMPIQAAPIPQPNADPSTAGVGVTTAPLQPELVTTRPSTPETVTLPPIVQTPLAPESPKFPPTLSLATMLLPPKSGGGIADPSQPLTFPPGELDTSTRITGMRLQFPANESNPVAKDNTSDLQWTYKDGFEGAIIEEAGRIASTSGAVAPLNLSWKDASGSMDVASLAFDQTNPRKPVLNVVWKASALVKRPDVVTVAYWLLQNSILETRHGPGGPDNSQQISFKRPPDQMIDLTSESTTLAFSVEIPKDFSVIAPAAADGSGLTAGWEATWYTDWDEKDAALRTAENAAQVVKFRKATASGSIDAWFLLRFGPGLKTVESTFVKRQDEARTQADVAAKEVQDIDNQIASLKKEYGASYDSSDKSKALAKSKADAQSLADGYREAIKAYDEVRDFNVAIALPGGLRVATVRFHRLEAPGINQGL